MVHVLLRGVDAPKGGALEIGGEKIVVTGAATNDQWPDVDVLPGDLAAFAWVRDDNISDSLAMLRRDARVIDATTDAGDRNTTRRRRKIDV